MKVKVLQVKNAKFKYRFSWKSYWVDVAIFDYNCTPFLLQMRVNRLNGKSFKSTRITGKKYLQSTCREIGDLTPMEPSE